MTVRTRKKSRERISPKRNPSLLSRAKSPSRSPHHAQLPVPIRTLSPISHSTMRILTHNDDEREDDVVGNTLNTDAHIYVGGKKYSHTPQRHSSIQKHHRMSKYKGKNTCPVHPCTLSGVHETFTLLHSDSRNTQQHSTRNNQQRHYTCGKTVGGNQLVVKKSPSPLKFCADARAGTHNVACLSHKYHHSLGHHVHVGSPPGESVSFRTSDSSDLAYIESLKRDLKTLEEELDREADKDHFIAMRQAEDQLTDEKHMEDELRARLEESNENAAILREYEEHKRNCAQLDADLQLSIVENAALCSKIEALRIPLVQSELVHNMKMQRIQSKINVVKNITRALVIGLRLNPANDPKIQELIS
eukprot:CFRG4183T1